MSHLAGINKHRFAEIMLEKQPGNAFKTYELDVSIRMILEQNGGARDRSRDGSG